jgi:hypothetical protein
VEVREDDRGDSQYRNRNTMGREEYLKQELHKQRERERERERERGDSLTLHVGVLRVGWVHVQKALML